MTQTARGLQDVYPLTPMQHGILIESLLAAEPVYVQQYHLEVTGFREQERLRAALRALIDRHDVLRAGLRWDIGDRPLHVIHSAVAPRLTTEDLRSAGDTQVRARIAALLAQERAAPFDLRTPPLLRVRAVRADDRAWHLVITYHHIVVDGWSIPLIHAELAELLGAAVAGRPAQLPEPHPFREFVTWQHRQADAPGDRRYFTDLLGDLTAATPLGPGLPERKPRPAPPTRNGRVIVTSTVPQDRSPAGAASRLGVLPSTIVNAAWALLLARWADVADVTFGMVVSGRPAELAQAASRVGMFVNTAVLRIPVPPDAQLGDWLKDVRERVDEAYLRSQASLVLAQECSGIPAGTPMVKSVVAFQNYWQEEQDEVHAGAVTVRVRGRGERVDLPISVGIALLDDGIWIRLDHDLTEVTHDEATRTARRFAHLIETLATAPGHTRLGDLPIDPPAAATADGSLDPAPGPQEARQRLLALIGERCRAGRAMITDWDRATTSRALWRSAVRTSDGLGAAPAIAAEGAELLAGVLAAVVAGEYPIILDTCAEASLLPRLVAGQGAGTLLVPAGVRPAMDPGVPVRELASPGPRDTGPAARRPASRAPGPRLGDLAGMALQLMSALGMDGTDVVSIVGVPASPLVAAAGLAALAAGARIDLCRPFEPVPASPTILFATPALAGPLLEHCAPGCHVVFLAEVPPRGLVARVLESARAAWRLPDALAARCVRLDSPDQAASMGRLPGAVVRDRHGRPVPSGNPGELAIAPAAGIGDRVRAAPRGTGLRVRELADGTIEQLGRGPGSGSGSADNSVLIEGIIGADPRVLDVALTAGATGSQAWVATAPGTDLTALTARADEALPPPLRPSGYRFVTALPVGPDGLIAREALTLAPVPVTRPPRDGARRGPAGHAPADGRVAALRARLAAARARTNGLRHTVRDQAPASAQMEQWRALSARALRAHNRIELGEEAYSKLVPATLAAFEGAGSTPLPAGGGVLSAAGDVLDVESLALLASPVASPAASRPALTHDDYAAWQRSPLRDADLAEQLERWRVTLDGQPTTGQLALDGGPGYGARAGHAADGMPDARHIAEQSRPASAAADPACWCAALTAAMCALSGADDIVLGVLLRPELPAELADVPGPYTRMLPVRLGPHLGGFRGLVAAADQALDVARRSGDVGWDELTGLLPEPPRVSLAVHGVPGALAAHSGVDLGIDVSPASPGEGVTVTAVHDVSVVHPRAVSRLLGLAIAILEAGQAAPDRPIHPADLVSGTDRDTLLRLGTGPVAAGLAGTAGTAADRGTDAADPWRFDTLHAAIRARSVIAPNAIAVDYRGELLTYRGLMAAADEVASRLRDLGIGVDDLVAICLPRTPAMVWSPLGVLIAGGGYVGLDVAYPQERLQTILRDSSARAVITTTALADRFAGGCPVLAVEDLGSGGSSSPVPDVALPGSMCCVIYTSGSTGKPKGVPLDHRGVTGFGRHVAAAYHIDTNSRVVSFAQLLFDASLFDLWTTLTAGGVVVLAGDEERASVEALQRLLAERRVTVGEIPPSLMPLLDPDALPDLRLVSVGGDAPAGRLVDTWATQRREFWNGYGPTETTVAVTLMNCQPPSGGRVPPIGLPMPDHRVYVLDPRQRLLPSGVPGELCVAGPGLSRGYLNLPAETAGRFVPDPFTDQPGQRMYRTGDLVRWTADDTLEFLGRVDRQVKVRGFRVEPGEVESVLGACPDIRQVLIEPWDDTDGTRHLVAYVIPADPDRPPTLPEVRAAGERALPHYMLPTRLVILGKMPRTPGGKVDRHALPAPAEPTAAGQPGSASAALTGIARAIATEVIAPLLRVSAVGPDDGFFELGGNSLQATQITSRIRDRFGVEVGLLEFFTTPTVRHLAELVERGRGIGAEPGRDARSSRSLPMTDGARLPASYPQAALAQACQAGGDRPGYHASLALRMRGRLDLAALRAAFAWLARRHAPLRTVFEVVDGEWAQTVMPADDPDFTVTDVPGTDESGRYAAVQTMIRQENERDFNLATGPLMRVRVYRLRPEDHVVQWTIHHVVTDGWSIGVQLHELGTAYHSYAQDSEPDLPPLPADYGDFVAWHRSYVSGPQYTQDLTWWRGHLGEFASTPGTATGDVTPSADEQFRDGWLNLRLPDETVRTALALARKEEATLYMVLLTAYAFLLSSLEGRDDVLVVSPYALRTRSEWEGLIGWFVNRVPVRVHVGSDPTFGELLGRVRAASLGAFAHARPPFELLRQDLGLADDAIGAQLNVQNAPAGESGFRGLEISLVPDDSGREFAPILEIYSPLRSHFRISLALRERGDGSIGGAIEYNAAVLSASQARSFADTLFNVLAAGTADPSIPLVSLLPAGEAGQRGYRGAAVGEVGRPAHGDQDSPVSGK